MQGPVTMAGGPPEPPEQVTPPEDVVPPEADAPPEEAVPPEPKNRRTSDAARGQGAPGGFVPPEAEEPPEEMEPPEDVLPPEEVVPPEAGAGRPHSQRYVSVKCVLATQARNEVATNIVESVQHQTAFCTPDFDKGERDPR